MRRLSAEGSGSDGRRRGESGLRRCVLRRCVLRRGQCAGARRLCGIRSDPRIIIRVAAPVFALPHRPLVCYSGLLVGPAGVERAEVVVARQLQDNIKLEDKRGQAILAVTRAQSARRPWPLGQAGSAHAVQNLETTLEEASLFKQQPGSRSLSSLQKKVELFFGLLNFKATIDLQETQYTFHRVGQRLTSHEITSF